MPLVRTFLGLMALLPLVASAAGDVAAGQAHSAPCAACHGQEGVATLPNSPNLAGQNAAYLVRQLTMIKSGVRSVPLMAGQLDALSDADLANLAAYYASLKAPVGQAAADNADKLTLGERIYRSGIASRGVAACTACHSPTGSGNALAGFPHLGGQTVQYVTTQLTAFREGNRATDDATGGVMRSVAKGLTDSDIAAVANYLQGLH